MVLTFITVSWCPFIIHLLSTYFYHFTLLVRWVQWFAFRYSVQYIIHSSEIFGSLFFSSFFIFHLAHIKSSSSNSYNLQPTIYKQMFHFSLSFPAWFSCYHHVNSMILKQCSSLLLFVLCHMCVWVNVCVCFIGGFYFVYHFLLLLLFANCSFYYYFIWILFAVIHIYCFYKFVCFVFEIKKLPSIIVATNCFLSLKFRFSLIRHFICYVLFLCCCGS